MKLKTALGKVLCGLEFHKWKSFRVVMEEDLADLQPEEGTVIKTCKRTNCQASTGQVYLKH